MDTIEDGQNYYYYLNLRTQDKHIYVYNKILNNPDLLQYCEKHRLHLINVLSENSPNTIPYFSEKFDWSWFHILRDNEKLKSTILDDTDRAIQMRHCSCFIAPELLSEEERNYFHSKWQPILSRQRNKMGN